MGRGLSGAEWAALADHVAPHTFDPTQPALIVSTFNAALRDARAAAGRCPDTGTLTGEPPVALWAGTLAYFALLDQIGDTLRPTFGREAKKVKGEAVESSIERALRQFTPSVTKRQRQALYGLRNSFAHEFGLFNIGKRLGRADPYRHKFTVGDAPGGRLVDGPSRRWNGKPETASKQTTTIVNLVTFGNLCEDVVRSVRTHAVSNQLRPRNGVSVERLQKQFSFRITDEP